MPNHTTPNPKPGRWAESALAAWYVCRCDYLPDRVWALWSRVPGAYRIYTSCSY